jgi:hypothetical protein
MLSLMLVCSFCFALASCGGTEECKHKDDNGDKICDLCDSVMAEEVELIRDGTALFRFVLPSGAEFIIDDTAIDARTTASGYNMNIFNVLSDFETVRVTDEELLSAIVSAGLGRETTKIDLGDEFDYAVMLIPRNKGHNVYRRRGYGAFAGEAMHEVIVLDKSGNVDPSTPIMFDYNALDYIDVYRLDGVKPLTLENGVFTTVASTVNMAYDSNNDGVMDTTKGGYIARGLCVERSYTTVKNVKHYVTGETPLDEQVDAAENIVKVSACYSGFYISKNANEVTFDGCVMTGRRCYLRPPGRHGRNV